MVEMKNKELTAQVTLDRELMMEVCRQANMKDIHRSTWIKLAVVEKLENLGVWPPKNSPSPESRPEAGE